MFSDLILYVPLNRIRRNPCLVAIVALRDHLVAEKATDQQVINDKCDRATLIRFIWMAVHYVTDGA